jgi:hypothetical protein
MALGHHDSAMANDTSHPISRAAAPQRRRGRALREAGAYRPMIRDLADRDRPRERLRDVGAGSLSNAELLAILLRTGTAAESVLDLAARCSLSSRGSRGSLARATASCATCTMVLRAEHHRLEMLLLELRHLGGQQVGDVLGRPDHRPLRAPRACQPPPQLDRGQQLRGLGVAEAIGRDGFVSLKEMGIGF